MTFWHGLCDGLVTAAAFILFFCARYWHKRCKELADRLNELEMGEDQ